MPIKTGVDIVYIPRIEKILKNSDAVRRLFHSLELKNTAPEHLAGIIAAKEAFFKVFEERPRWLEIEVKTKKNGKPTFVLNKKYEKMIKSIDVSISHDHDYAIACVVVEV